MISSFCHHDNSLLIKCPKTLDFHICKKVGLLIFILTAYLSSDKIVKITSEIEVFNFVKMPTFRCHDNGTFSKNAGLISVFIAKSLLLSHNVYMYVVHVPFGSSVIFGFRYMLNRLFCENWKFAQIWDFEPWIALSFHNQFYNIFNKIVDSLYKIYMIRVLNLNQSEKWVISLTK